MACTFMFICKGMHENHMYLYICMSMYSNICAYEWILLPVHYWRITQECSKNVVILLLCFIGIKCINYVLHLCCIYIYTCPMSEGPAGKLFRGP